MNCWVKFFLLLSMPVLLIVLAYLPGIDSESWYPDAGRHAMDGAFYLDLFSGQLSLSDFPSSIWQYEAHYPAIKPHTYPPVFAVVESFFFAVFGLSFFSARLAALAFLVLGAVFFYRIARRFYGEVLSLAGTLLFLSCPVVLRWGREVMLEIPALAMILGALYFYLRAFEKTDDGEPPKTKVKYLLCCLVFAVLVPYTKQTAGHFLLVLFLATGLNFGWKFLFKKTQLLGGLLGIFFLLPLLFITMKYGGALLGQVFDSQAALSDPRPESWSIRSLSAWLFYPGELVSMLGAPLLCLSVFGIFAGFKSKSRDWIRLHWLWLFLAYLIFTFMAYKNERHGIYLILPLLFLCLEALSFLSQFRSWGKALAYSLLAGVLIFQGWNIRSEQRHLSGAKEAIDYVRAKNFDGCLFIQAHSNANLVFEWRASGKCWDKPVLRSSRLFGRQRTMGMFGTKDYVKSREEMIALLEKYKCQYIIVEDKDYLRQPVYKLFLELLSDTKLFELEKKIAIKLTNPLKGQGLPEYQGAQYLIYRFKEKFNGKAGVLEYELWSGEKKRVPFHPEYTGD